MGNLSHRVIGRDFHRMVQVLHGFKANARNAEERAPFHFPVGSDCSRVTGLVIGITANTRAASKKGKVAKHLCVERGHVATSGALLSVWTECCPRPFPA